MEIPGIPISVNEAERCCVLCKTMGRICTLQCKDSFLPSLGATAKSPAAIFWHVGHTEGEIKDDSV